jgi:poly(hydroxyalkanoate) granule-associated protein
MARKTGSRRRSTTSGSDSSQTMRDSAQRIWLAGLGAFERAKTDGPKMFESLVEQGRNMGARAVGAADDALKNMRQASFSGGRWDKLEQAVEDRVSKSLARLGLLTGREVESLSRQVAELNETVHDLMRGGAPAAKRAAKPAKGTAKRARRTAKSAQTAGKRAKGTAPRAPSTAKRATGTAGRSTAQRAGKSKSKARAAAKSTPPRE